MKKLIYGSFLLSLCVEAANPVTINVPVINTTTTAPTTTPVGSITGGNVCLAVSRICVSGLPAKMTLNCREFCPEDKRPLGPTETVNIGKETGGNQVGFFIQSATLSGMSSILDLVNGDSQGALQSMTSVGTTMESARKLGDGNFQKINSSQLNTSQLNKVAEKLEKASGLTKNDILSFVLSTEGGNSCSSAGNKMQSLINKIQNADAKEKMERALEDAKSSSGSTFQESFSATGCKGDSLESSSVSTKVKEEKTAEEKEKDKKAAEEREAAEKVEQAKQDALNAYKSFLEAKSAGLTKEKRTKELEELNRMMDEVTMSKLDNADSEANEISIFARVKLKYRILTKQEWLDQPVPDLVKDKGPKK